MAPNVKRRKDVSEWDGLRALFYEVVAQERGALTLYRSGRVALRSIWRSKKPIGLRILALRLELRLRAADRFYREESGLKALLFLALERLLDARQEGWRLDSVLSRRLRKQRFCEVIQRQQSQKQETAAEYAQLGSTKRT